MYTLLTLKIRFSPGMKEPGLKPLMVSGVALFCLASCGGEPFAPALSSVSPGEAA